LVTQEVINPLQDRTLTALAILFFPISFVGYEILLTVELPEPFSMTRNKYLTHHNYHSSGVDSAIYPMNDRDCKIKSGQSMKLITYDSRSPLIRINWDDVPSGYAENPDN
jgi:hypothetical protein